MRILIKGAGDLASGIAVRLFACGFQIIMTETEMPTTVRCMAAFSRVVYEETKTAVLEGITARLVTEAWPLEKILEQGEIAVAVDPKLQDLERYHPDVVVDAILAKRNLGTAITDADIVIGVGPGFTARTDCHYVVETMRGHELGRVITEGSAIPNTGVPGEVGGYTAERLIRAEADGIFVPKVKIGDTVSKGEIVAMSGDVPVRAKMSGIVRGMLPDLGMSVRTGMKCGDIDARCCEEHCHTVSDKARAVGGGVLEAILRGCLRKKQEREQHGWQINTF